MPAAMHCFYLRNMYQENLLVKAGRDHARWRADRSRQGQDAGVPAVDPRGPHRAVAVDLCRDPDLQGAGQIRAGRLGPHRRRRQSARQQIRALGERQKPADARGMARLGATQHPEFMVAGVGALDREIFRRRGAGAPVPATASSSRSRTRPAPTSRCGPRIDPAVRSVLGIAGQGALPG